MKLISLLILLFMGPFSWASQLQKLEDDLNSLKVVAPQEVSYSEITRLWKGVAKLEHSEEENLPLRVWADRKNKLLMEVGEFRYQVIQSNGLKLTQRSFFEDSLFEIQIIPKRWISLFEVKYLEIKAKLKMDSGHLFF